MQTPSGAAFDQVASDYDATATDLLVSRWLRERVWERLALLFQPGQHILEIGCGTGEDAIWLARRGVHVTASDVSVAMLDQARLKATQAGMADRITFRHLDLAEAQHWALPTQTTQTYDGVLSNFGALNCVGPDGWRALGSTLAGSVRPGGSLALAVMGPFCAWETLWHGLHGDFRTATRRWSGQAVAQVGGVSFAVHYPTAARLVRALGPAFRQRRVSGLGVFLSPGDLYAALSRRQRLAHVLLRLERWTAPRWPFTALGDHYWLELERTAS